MIETLRNIFKRSRDEDFTPDRMRDCAKMLRAWMGPGKKKATKYADMLERLASHDEWVRSQIRKDLETKRYHPDYEADQ